MLEESPTFSGNFYKDKKIFFEKIYFSTPEIRELLLKEVTENYGEKKGDKRLKLMSKKLNNNRAENLGNYF